VVQTSEGSATTDYLYGHEQLLAQTGTVQTWYGSDALGSVRQTLDDTGTPLASLSYDPWGTPQDSATPPTFGFTGELQDAASGLVYLRARWYQPGAASFLSRDPFSGFPQQPYSLHPYQYAYADPVLYTDPTGLCTLGPDGKPLPCRNPGPVPSNCPGGAPCRDPHRVELEQLFAGTRWGTIDRIMGLGSVILGTAKTYNPAFALRTTDEYAAIMVALLLNERGNPKEQQYGPVLSNLGLNAWNMCELGVETFRFHLGLEFFAGFESLENEKGIKSLSIGLINTRNTVLRNIMNGIVPARDTERRPEQQVDFGFSGALQGAPPVNVPGEAALRMHDPFSVVLLGAQVKSALYAMQALQLPFTLERVVKSVAGYHYTNRVHPDIIKEHAPTQKYANDAWAKYGRAERIVELMHQQVEGR